MERTIGRVTVATDRGEDDYPDFSWLGEFSNYQEPRHVGEKLVHRSSGAILDHHGIWRDERGRIVPTPEESSFSREYAYTFHDNGHECLSYAWHDHRRMEALERGEWCFVVVTAKVIVDGVTIGEAALGGVESDSEDSYLRSIEHEMAREAIEHARIWLKGLTLSGGWLNNPVAREKDGGKYGDPLQHHRSLGAWAVGGDRAHDCPHPSLPARRPLV